MAEQMKGLGVVIGIGAALGTLAVLALGAAALAKPEEPEEPEPGMATLYGKVTDAETGLPIADTQVTLDGMQTFTNISGYYEFTEVEIGGYAAQFLREGYATEVR